MLDGAVAASASLSGPNAGTGLSTLTVKNAANAVIEQLTLSGNFAGLAPVVAADGSIQLKPQHAADFNGDGVSDILFRDAQGALSTWQLQNGLQTGGGSLVTPAGPWAALASADFDGDASPTS